MAGWEGPRVRLGNYEPLMDLASGGMGTVHIARHVGAAGFERLVVIKRVHRHLLKDREFHDMFVDEARVASLIRHPNVVPVIDVVEDKGELFLVLDYVESMSMHALVKEAQLAGEPLPVPVIVRILADVLSGLHAAHEATDMQGNPLDVVHRDVSPQNVIVGLDGTSRLIDFGIAKATRRLTVTSGGVLKGKFGYMSPEQLKQLPLDRRADVFAAGVVLYEALTSQRPFTGDDDGDALLALLLGDIADPSTLAPDIPPKLDAVVQYALARDRHERFQTAGAFLQALETAVAPAPPREVARYVEKHGGDLLERRRKALRAMLGASTDPKAAPEVQQTSTTLSHTLPDDYAPASTDGGTVTTPRSPLVPRAVLVGGLVVAAAVTGIVIFSQRGGTPSPTASSTETAAPPLTASGGARAQAIEVVVIADAPIESVRASGIRTSELMGTRARLELAPWSGVLPVTAVVQGGAVVTGTIDERGPREVHLAPAENPQPSASAPLRPHVPGPRPPPSTDLRKNPY